MHVISYGSTADTTFILKSHIAKSVGSATMTILIVYHFRQIFICLPVSYGQDVEDGVTATVASHDAAALSTDHVPDSQPPIT